MNLPPNDSYPTRAGHEAIGYLTTQWNRFAAQRGVMSTAQFKSVYPTILSKLKVPGNNAQFQQICTLAEQILVTAIKQSSIDLSVLANFYSNIFAEANPLQAGLNEAVGEYFLSFFSQAPTAHVDIIKHEGKIVGAAVNNHRFIGPLVPLVHSHTIHVLQNEAPEAAQDLHVLTQLFPRYVSLLSQLNHNMHNLIPGEAVGAHPRPAAAEEPGVKRARIEERKFVHVNKHQFDSNSANSFAVNGNYKEAEKCYLAALQSAPTMDEQNQIKIYLGTLYFILNDFTKAERFLSDSSLFNILHAQKLLALLYTNSKQHDERLHQVCLKILNREPQNTIGIVGEGYCSLAFKGNLKGSIKNLNNVKYTNEPEVFLLLAELHLQQDGSDKYIPIVFLLLEANQLAEKKKTLLSKDHDVHPLQKIASIKILNGMIERITFLITIIAKEMSGDEEMPPLLRDFLRERETLVFHDEGYQTLKKFIEIPPRNWLFVNEVQAAADDKFFHEYKPAPLASTESKVQKSEGDAYSSTDELGSYFLSIKPEDVNSPLPFSPDPLMDDKDFRESESDKPK